MKTRQQLVTAYAAGRGNLLIMAVLTAVNTALALFGSSWTFLFSAFFPCVCANRAALGYPGMPEGALLLGCLLPIAVWFACWLLSDKQRCLRWTACTCCISSSPTASTPPLF